MRYEYELAREKLRERWNYVRETPRRWKEDIGEGVAKQFPRVAKRFEKVRAWAEKGEKLPYEEDEFGDNKAGKDESKSQDKAQKCSSRSK